MSHRMETEPANVSRVLPVIFQPNKIHRCAMPVHWDGLPIKKYPRVKTLHSIVVNRVQEVRLVVKLQPTMCGKGAATAPVVGIPKSMAELLSMIAKDVPKASGVRQLV